MNDSSAITKKNAQLEKLIAQRNKLRKDKKDVIKKMEKYIEANAPKMDLDLEKKCFEAPNTYIEIEKSSRECRSYIKGKMIFEKESRDYMQDKSDKLEQLRAQIEKINFSIIELPKDEE